MILTNEERQKFITYLKQNIESSRLLIEQMEKLSGAAMMVGPEKTKIAAWLIVAADLESHELMEIKSETKDLK